MPVLNVPNYGPVSFSDTDSEEQIKAFLLRGIEEPESYKEFINSLALDFQKNTLANKDFIANLQRTSDADYKDQIVKAELNDNSKPIDEKIKLADHHFNINSEICKIIDDCTPDRDLARSKVFSFQSERQKYLIKWFTYLNSFKIQKEFERRKKILEESIDALSTGTKEQVSKSEVYQKVYDKIVKGSENAEQVMSKVDPVNREAIEDWKEIHENNFEELSDYMLNIHNTLLEKEINYSSPDRYLKIEQGAEKDLADNQAMYGRAGEYLYQREASGLMKAEHPENLPKNKYRDYSFDKNNVESLHDALVDMNTGFAIRQLDAFIKSNYFKKIIPSSEDRNLLNRRFVRYIENTRNKSEFGGEDIAAFVKAIDRIATVGTGMALGSPLQAVKQVIPVGFNTFINAGRLNLGTPFNADYNNFLDNSGYATANRGVESQAEISSLNKQIEQASNPADLFKAIEKANKWWLKTFLVRPDVYIARSSWKTYYEKSLRKQGIDLKKLDYKDHKLNKEAADYAEMMVSRQQNVSDHDLSGSWFTNNTPDRKVLRKIFLNMANFRMNQSARLASDLTTIGHWTTSSAEDKLIAARSLAGFAAEMAVFKILSAGIQIGIGDIAQYVRGINESDKDKKKRHDAVMKGQFTGAVIDIFSPAPFLDIPTKMVLSPTLDKLAEETGLPLSIYGVNKESFAQSLGAYGIAIERGAELYDVIKLGTTGKYKDEYGKEKKISKEDQETIEALIPFSVGTVIGLIPSDVASGIRNVVKYSKQKSTTNEEYQAIEERAAKKSQTIQKKMTALSDLIDESTDEDFIDEANEKLYELSGSPEAKEFKKQQDEADKQRKKQLLTDPETGEVYDSEGKLKKYNKALWDENFGPNSEWEEDHKVEDEVQKQMNKGVTKIEEEEKDYVAPVKNKKRKNSDGTRKRTYSRKLSSGSGSSSTSIVRDANGKIIRKSYRRSGQ